MKISQKKNCNRCAAGKHNRCELGYKVEWYSDEPTGIRAFGVPCEPCPKPLTIKDFLFLKKNSNGGIL